MKTINFYFPLRGEIISQDDDGYDYDNPYEIYGDSLSGYKEEIDDAFESYLDGDDMSQYFDEDDNAEVAAKLHSMTWSFPEIGYDLFGKVEVVLTDDISDKGVQDLKDFITGQNSDGLGEGFEQQDISIDDGDRLNVRMWNGDEYFIDTEEEFKERYELDEIDESDDGIVQSM